MKILHSTFYILHSSPRGQTSLSLVFIIGGIILLVATTLAFVVISFLNSSFGFQTSNRSLALAASGVHDGMIQLIRNKDFSDTSGYCVPAASLPCPSGSATVTVTQNSPATGQATIVATGRILTYRRRIQAIANVSSSTGNVELTSWSLQAF